MDSNQKGRTQYEIVGGDGEIYGPYSLKDFQQYLNEQRVQSDTHEGIRYRRLDGT